MCHQDWSYNYQSCIVTYICMYIHVIWIWAAHKSIRPSAGTVVTSMVGTLTSMLWLLVIFFKQFGLDNVIKDGCPDFTKSHCIFKYWYIDYLRELSMCSYFPCFSTVVCVLVTKVVKPNGYVMHAPLLYIKCDRHQYWFPSDYTMLHGI